jgi:hypothetical protein
MNFHHPAPEVSPVESLRSNGFGTHRRRGLSNLIVPPEFRRRPLVVRRQAGVTAGDIERSCLVSPLLLVAGRAPPRLGGARRRFRVVFAAEQGLEAEDIRDALEQAEALGATDITSITRTD